MELACKVWRVLVGVKDALVLAAMLLFFALVYAVLTQRPMTHRAEKGALLLNMRGTIVEELQSPDPLQVLAGGGRPASELRERDVLRAISGAATDPAIKAVVRKGRRAKIAPKAAGYASVEHLAQDLEDVLRGALAGHQIAQRLSDLADRSKQ